ncbi:hypothetical protein LCGC14_2458540 [marine sediment metagenome]|uniref:Uncharacterized protein n=1 Tax=marine sediment metagenome TaxID=412755 RepID=A0A0F9E7U7_9ZZZZ
MTTYCKMAEGDDSDIVCRKDAECCPNAYSGPLHPIYCKGSGVITVTEQQREWCKACLGSMFEKQTCDLACCPSACGMPLRQTLCDDPSGGVRTAKQPDTTKPDYKHYKPQYVDANGEPVKVAHDWFMYNCQANNLWCDDPDHNCVEWRKTQPPSELPPGEANPA